MKHWLIAAIVLLGTTALTAHEPWTPGYNGRVRIWTPQTVWTPQDYSAQTRLHLWSDSGFYRSGIFGAGVLPYYRPYYRSGSRLETILTPMPQQGFRMPPENCPPPHHR